METAFAFIFPPSLRRASQLSLSKDLHEFLCKQIYRIANFSLMLRCTEWEGVGRNYVNRRLAQFYLH